MGALITSTNCATFTRDIARKVGGGWIPQRLLGHANLSAIWNPNDRYRTFEG